MQRLSGMDAAFLHLETPVTPMNVVGVLRLDPSGGAGWSVGRFREVVASRLHLMPPLQRRLAGVPLGLDNPVWLHDPDVDLDVHIRHVMAPPPGDEHVLGHLIGEFAGSCLDRARPMWEMIVIDGLADGSVTVIAKLHHSAIYGEAGAEFIAQVLDFDAVGREVEPAPEDHSEAAPNAGGRLARGLAHQALGPWRFARQAARSSRGVAGLATSAIRPSGAGVGSLPRGAPRTPLNGTLTSRREVAFARLPLAEVKAIKNAHGGTVNDVLLAAVAGALRRYLLDVLQVDLPGRPMVASCPISAGGGSNEATNVISAMLVDLPVGEPDAARRLEQVSASARAAKSVAHTFGLEAFAGWADVLPPPLLGAGARLYNALGLADRHPPLQNLVVSNVIGPPIPLFVAGARLEAIYPLGPLLPGTGLNVTAMSTMGNLDVGLLACPDLVPDVWALAEGIAPALAPLRLSS
jgi:WS/DGAT/MGAT family acyltransferase